MSTDTTWTSFNVDGNVSVEREVLIILVITLVTVGTTVSRRVAGIGSNGYVVGPLWSLDTLLYVRRVNMGKEQGEG